MYTILSSNEHTNLELQASGNNRAATYDEARELLRYAARREIALDGRGNWNNLRKFLELGAHRTEAFEIRPVHPFFGTRGDVHATITIVPDDVDAHLRLVDERDAEMDRKTEADIRRAYFECKAQGIPIPKEWEEKYGTEEVTRD